MQLNHKNRVIKIKHEKLTDEKFNWQIYGMYMYLMIHHVYICVHVYMHRAHKYCDLVIDLGPHLGSINVLHVIYQLVYVLTTVAQSPLTFPAASASLFSAENFCSFSWSTIL